MKLKLDGSGKAEVQDGKPVYVRDDGSEVAFDAPATVATIKRISDERDAARTEATNAKEALDPFKGLDAKAAREAVDKLKLVDQGKLLAADKVEELKKQVAADITAGWEQKLKDSQTALEAKETALAAEKARVHKLVLGAQFARDPHFESPDGGKTPPKTFLSPDIGLEFFGKYFEPSDKPGPDGEPVFIPKLNGRELYSPAKPGNVASFSEAVAILIAERPDKGRFMRDQSGSGAGANGGAAANGHHTDKSMEGLSPEDRLARSFGAPA
jgi:hypothetical protein